MNMEIFVQSRGFSRKHDYRWRKLTGDNDSNSRLNSEATLYEKEIKPLIDTRSDAFSVVFGRSNQQVYLLVSGLPSSRKDVEKRFISNSALWISYNPDSDEPILRKLAIYALLSHISVQSEQLKLEKKLDSVITIDDVSGFSVQFEQLLPSQLITGTPVRSLGELKRQPVKLYSNDEVLKLTKDMESHSLPKGERNLVIVTGNKSKIILDNPKVLRGLSIFDAPKLNLESPPEPSLPSKLEEAKESVENFLDKCKKHFFTSLISVAITTVAITTVVLLAAPVRNLISPSSSSIPCPPVPDIELLSSSRRFVVGEAATLRGDYDPQKITKIVLLDETKQPLGEENQNIQLSSSTRTWKYSFLGFQVPGRKRLILQGFDQSGKLIVEQVIPAIVDPDASTFGTTN